ncbi:uncharacterized protein LOC125369992 [Ricinus communis]|uniref:uncharacterized protein LOC125369992 n=1 Tax=Ricinus communis TaxID=3988 RepID=UPI00201AE305|nr:uncharacterized protein LOC125369992 [Ricinus communis]
MATTKWLADELLNEFRKKPNYSVAEMDYDLMIKYVMKVSICSCYKAKKLALVKLRGSIEVHYAKLRSYMHELKKVDRKGCFDLEYNMEEDNSIFQGLYIYFCGLRKGFMQGCRPIISPDGAFLKNILGDAILSKIGRDDNNQMYPIAWAAMLAENESTWRWFLTRFFNDLFIDTVYSIYEAQFMANLKVFREVDPEAEDGFISKDPRVFCKAYKSTLPKCDNIDNNIAETFNGWICKAKLLHIIDMLEEIRCALIEMIKIKSDIMKNSVDVLCPRIRKKIEKLKWETKFCIPKPALNDKFQVKVFDEQFVMSLPDRSCTCKAWQLIGISCIHAIFSIHWLRQNIDDYVDECYKKVMYYKKK